MCLGSFWFKLVCGNSSKILLRHFEWSQSNRLSCILFAFDVRWTQPNLNEQEAWTRAFSRKTFVVWYKVKYRIQKWVIDLRLLVPRTHRFLRSRNLWNGCFECLEMPERTLRTLNLKRQKKSAGNLIVTCTARRKMLLNNVIGSISSLLCTRESFLTL